MVGGMGSIIGDIPVFVTDVNVSSRAHEAGLKVTFCLQFYSSPFFLLSCSKNDGCCFLAFCFSRQNFNQKCKLVDQNTACFLR